MSVVTMSVVYGVSTPHQDIHYELYCGAHACYLCGFNRQAPVHLDELTVVIIVKQQITCHILLSRRVSYYYCEI